MAQDRERGRQGGNLSGGGGSRGGGGKEATTVSRRSDAEPSGASQRGKQASAAGADRQRGRGREGGDAHRPPTAGQIDSDDNINTGSGGNRTR